MCVRTSCNYYKSVDPNHIYDLAQVFESYQESSYNFVITIPNLIRINFQLVPCIALAGSIWSTTVTYTAGIIGLRSTIFH